MSRGRGENGGEHSQVSLSGRTIASGRPAGVPRDRGDERRAVLAATSQDSEIPDRFSVDINNLLAGVMEIGACCCYCVELYGKRMSIRDDT